MPALALALLALAAPQELDAGARAFLDTHCVRCHGGERPQGELDLGAEAVPSREVVRAAPGDWDWLRYRVAEGEMPPKGEARPTEDEVAAFLAWVDAALADAPESAGDAPVDPGRPVLRRLTNAMYANAVRDLFGVSFDAGERFPTDPIGHGFTTVGDAQSMPDELFELYLAAAEDVAERAIVVDLPGGPSDIRLSAADLDGDGRPARGAWVLSTRGTVGATLPLRRAGRYSVRVEVGAQQAGDEPARIRIAGEGDASEPIDVSWRPEAMEVVEARLDLPRGPTRIGVRFLNDHYEPDHPDPSRRDRNLWVRSVEVTGPLDDTPRSAFQRELLARFPEELGGNRERAVVRHLARRVWRRPPEDREVDRLVRMTPRDLPLEASLQHALVALLASPHFLFLVEEDGGGGERPLTGHERAARLAAFLWSSVPDEGLDAAADAGELDDAAGVAAAVDRMLADPRADALADGFLTEWLQLGPLATTTVDRRSFPSFSLRLRDSMAGETRRVFLDHLRAGRPLWELVDGTTSIVDRRLAELYGVDAAAGEEVDDGWYRVDLASTGRRGLLGQAAILTLTSEPTRTSPVKRGKWVLDVLLGSPPPPPPPGLDSLEAGPGADPSLPIRERLELHRTRPDCAACHARMDPLGFGLEGFDGIGAARATVGGRPVDSSGELPDGRTFDGAVELAAILRDDGAFPRVVLERLLVYALGRPLRPADRTLVREALGAFDPETVSLADLIHAIVTSRAFTHRAGAP